MRSGRSAFKAPDERVRRARGPEMVELGRIPGSLKSDLRYANRVGVGTLGSVVEVLRGDSVVHVRLMVGAVKVLAIPASGLGQQEIRHTGASFH